jgi:hypothetical protein
MSALPGLALPFGLALACAAMRAPEEPLFAPAPGLPFALPGASEAVLPGDLDRDGKTDLVAVCSEPLSVSVLRGDGTGRFAPGAALMLDFPAPPTDLVLADLDGDGSLDVAGATHDSSDVLVLWGDGKGGLGPPRGVRFASGAQGRPHTHGLLAHDVTRDGKLDLLLSQSDPQDALYVLSNDGKRGFAPQEPPLPLGRSAYPPTLATLDGDELADLVSPAMNSAPAALTLARGRAAGGFEQPAVIPVAVGRPFYVAAGDLDGDRDLDLAVTHDDAAQASLLLNQAGAFTPTAASPLELGGPTWAVHLCDRDGDGRADLVAAGGSVARAFLSDGRGGFAPAPGSPFAVARGAWRLALADVNGDRKTDLVACGAEAKEITVLLHR